jgi:hypothetical protein
VVLLTWNSEQFVVECVNSITSSIQRNDFEIIVIDNGSTDHTLEILKKNFPNLQIIENLQNQGVARARNQGIARTKGTYVVLLDIDTVLPDGTIDGLTAFMDNNPMVGICAPKLLSPDGTVQNSCRKFPLIHSKILRRMRGKWADAMLKEEYYQGEISQHVPFDGDYVIGACQVIRRTALDEIGYLDQKIFYGPEDVDICLRMHLKKWRVVYIPSFTVIHFEQRVTKCKLVSKLTLKHTCALLYFFLKYKYFFSRKTLYKRISSRT